MRDYNQAPGHLINVNGKVVGVKQGDNCAYYHSDTPDSPFSNLYKPKDGITLYLKKGQYISARPHVTEDGQLEPGEVPGKFSSVEQIFAFGKAKVSGDRDAMVKIFRNPDMTGADFRRIGRQIKGYSDEKWKTPNQYGETAADQWMRLGMQAKIRCDKQTRDALHKVVDEQGLSLVEASPYDKNWGAGKSIYQDTSSYTGKNQQGVNLMKSWNTVAPEFNYQKKSKSVEKAIE